MSELHCILADLPQQHSPCPAVVFLQAAIAAAVRTTAEFLSLHVYCFDIRFRMQLTSPAVPPHTALLQQS
jgi:hypothetical protein